MWTEHLVLLKGDGLFLIGASVAEWSDRSPFTSVTGSILSENVLNVTRTQYRTHVKRVSQHSAESRGFSPGAPVSSHKEVDSMGWDKHRQGSKISIVVKIASQG